VVDLDSTNPKQSSRSIASACGKLRAVLLKLIRQHEEAGTLPTSGRFLFYELVAMGVISKQRKNGGRRSDQNMTDALVRLREQGTIPWEWIVDETRSLDQPFVDKSIAAWLLRAMKQARIDPWAGNAPLILTESRSLAGVLRTLTRNYAVPIAPTNGQCGGFLHTEVAPSMHPGQRVLYLGDLDYSGNQIEANTRHVLEREVGKIRWERLALTQEQAQKYRLPEIMKPDRRFRPAKMMPAIETEALRQEIIVEIVRARLQALLPQPIERVLEREKRQRKVLMPDLIFRLK